MTKEQALQILKNTLDAAIKSGICSTLEASSYIVTAWQTILNELKKADANQ